MHRRTALRVGACVALYAAFGAACGGSDDTDNPPAVSDEGGTVDGGADAPASLGLGIEAGTPSPPLCGPMAKDCLGGACVNDACMPVMLYAPVGDQIGQALAIDETSLYWTQYPADAGADQNGSIRRMLLDGGSATILSGGQPTPARIAVDTFGVYWTSQGTAAMQYTDGYVSVLNKACGDSCVSRLITSEANPYPITSFGGRVYWGVFNGSVIRSSLPDGGDLTTLAADGGAANPFGIAVDATGAYITDAQGFLVMLSPSGDVVSRVPAGVLPFGVMVDPNNVYWSDFRGNTVFNQPKDGGPAAPFAEAQGTPGVLAQDDTHVYWVDLGTDVESYKDGAIVRRTKDACVAPPCIEILASFQAKPVGIAVDGKAVYWLLATGQVMKLAK